MTTAQKNMAKREQIERFSHQKVTDIKNRKLKFMAAHDLTSTVSALKENDFAIVKTALMVRAYSNEGLIFQAMKMNSSSYSVLFDNSYFDGSIK